MPYFIRQDGCDVIKSFVLTFSYGIGSALLVLMMLAGANEDEKQWTILSFIQAVMTVIGGLVLALMFSYLIFGVLSVIMGAYEFIESIIWS